MPAPIVIAYGQGDQTVRVVPLDDEMRPVVVSSASYQIDDLREPKGSTKRVVVAKTSVTQQSGSTTTTADAGPTQADPFTISVTDASSFVVGESLLLIDSNGARELVEVDAKDATSVRSRWPLRRTFVSGSTLRQIEIDGTFPGTVANDEDRLESEGGPFRVRWYYLDETGRQVVLDQTAWIRRSTRPRLVTASDVLRAWPMAARWAHDELSIESAVQVAHDDYYAALVGAGIDPTRTFAEDAARAAITKRALYYLHLWRGREESLSIADRFRDEYQTAVSGIVSGLPGKHAVRTNEDDEAPAGDAQTLGQLFVET